MRLFSIPPAPGASLFILSRGYRQAIQPMLIWILIFFTRPHKVSVIIANMYMCVPRTFLLWGRRLLVLPIYYATLAIIILFITAIITFLFPIGNYLGCIYNTTTCVYIFFPRRRGFCFQSILSSPCVQPSLFIYCPLVKIIVSYTHIICM